ncbi:hypothetical protein [Salipiger sp.]|uniref:hypothetical protein n=1 Tax=Salipiger sp. TaxID=2078585 RepID=UPI003A96A4E5
MSKKKDPSAPDRFGIAARKTHEAAMAIIDDETEARREKTRRLRAARLERETGVAPARKKARTSVP